MVPNELDSNAKTLEKLNGTRGFFMTRAMVPDQLVVDARKGDDLWKSVTVALMPMGPKHFLGVATPGAQVTLSHLQEEWGTGPDSFPAMIFVAMGTMSHRGEWAMVNPDDFKKTPADLLKDLKQAREEAGGGGNNRREESVELVYTAVTGERPPGSNRFPPLKEIPAKAY